jgi:hypothetical protein
MIIENWLFHQGGFFFMSFCSMDRYQNVKTPTFTSQIAHFWRGIRAKCRGILAALDGIEDGISFT